MTIFGETEMTFNRLISDWFEIYLTVIKNGDIQALFNHLPDLIN
jgi:hypothetical protein